jgi:hypothetical protein
VNEKQLGRFGEAVEEKKARSKEASENAAPPQPASGPVPPGDQQDLVSPARPQDTQSVRAKNSGKGKKTADKWNQ